MGKEVFPWTANHLETETCLDESSLSVPGLNIPDEKAGNELRRCRAEGSSGKARTSSLAPCHIGGCILRASVSTSFAILRAAFGKQQEGASSRANLYALARATREDISSAGARVCTHRPQLSQLLLVSVSRENQDTYSGWFNMYLGALL